MAVYLILASVIIRALVMFGGQQRPIVLALLIVYGILLAVYQQRSTWFAADRRRAVIYLGALSLLVIGLILIPPHFDYFPLLFVPISLYAVELLGRRYGFLLITVFVLIMLWQYVIMIIFVRQVYAVDASTGLAMSILFGAMCFLVGQIVCIRRQAEQARANNQRLLADLQVTHRQLQDHAEQLEELAVVQERSRLARELHDSVTQTVFSMTLAVQTAQVLITKDVSRVAAQLDRVVELARNASREVQTIVKQLRPASIAEQGLAAALQDYLAERQARDGLVAYLEVNGEARWPENVTLGLYRIVQEAVNNVIKHAGTREVIIKLNACNHPASVEVIDHGAGFVANDLTPQRGHMGLVSMAERAREFGWTMTLESQPGAGTCVKVSER
ncbi:MAG TPA: sensor histidine kinase [Anaerolineae bacterium]|nr:sensor histidine kinase [Anaerolineae bacterium]